MKSLQDAIYNWLTIKVVADARPDDLAAKETEEMFYQMLVKDYGVTNIEVNKDEAMYYVAVEKDGERKSYRFPNPFIEMMLEQINNEPEKYRNYTIE